MALLLSALSSLLVGIVLLVAPWTVLWEGNVLLQPSSWLRGVLLSPFARGAVSGLGLVNIVLAIDEARQLLAGSSDHVA
ncbi:MAG TPA: hypothetical protein VFM88_14005 [Vicinamibacteria bacterium]|nr:hypothetical protein [Vicinamibacteria bacterium]